MASDYQKVPTDFVIRVYETKALAEKGDENNALTVFHNGIDAGASADPAIGNAAQLISGVSTSVSSNQLIDTNARFGDRLLNKDVYNTRSILGPTETGKGKKFDGININSVSADGTTLTLDDDLFPTGGVATITDYSPSGAALAGDWEPGSGFPPYKIYYNRSQTSTSGSGTGIKVTIVVNSLGKPLFYIQKPGRGYNISDTIVFTDPGATSNTATITVSSVSDTAFRYFIEAPGNFFTFQKYFYRIEASDLVRGFVIDWDDGEDNSPEKANRQTIKLDVPLTYAIVSHTYTTHGKHYPMVRTISVDGFYSKWYTTSDANVAGLDSIETQTLSSGQNDYSIISIDSATTPRIPEFMPANSPPIGVLKMDRNTVYSCIDNDILEGFDDPVIYCYIERKGGNACNFAWGLEITWEDTGGNVTKELVTAHSTLATIQAATDVGPYGVGGAESGTLGLYVKKLLAVKIINLKEGTANNSDNILGPDERIYLHVAEFDETFAPADDPIITMVSLGNPIQYLSRPGFSVIADGSQSQTRCSNVSISKYIFDEGKLKGAHAPTGSADVSFSIGMYDQVSDIIGNTTTTGLVNTSSQSDSFKQIHYTLAPNNSPLSSSGGNIIDSKTKRIFDEERLIRLQVSDSSVSSRQDVTVQYTQAYTSLALAAEAMSDVETGMDVTDGSLFSVGDVIAKYHADYTTGEQILVTAINGDTLTLSRSYNGVTAETIADTDPLYILYDGGRLGDSCTHSFIEHWEPRGYSTHINRPDSLKTKALLQYGTALDPSNDDDAIQVKWRAINFDGATDGYRKQTRAILASPTDDGEPGLIFGGIGGTDGNVTNKVQLATNTFLSGRGSRAFDKANNFLLMCKDKKFNRIHLRMKNEFTSVTGTSEGTSDVVWSDEKVSLILWYTARTSPTASTYEWKPLPFTDLTSVRTYDTVDGGVDENTSLRRSGSLIFDMPNDWVKVDSNDLTWDGAAKPISDEDIDTETTDDPALMWEDKMYGILLGIAIDDDSAPQKYKCIDLQTYNNSHSSVIVVEDPHHKSLNDIAIAQSITWKRDGNYHTSQTRAGYTEIKRMGSSGGKVTFGSVELSGNYSTQKKLLNIYQREGTPVYLDVQRAVDSGEYIRFYGVLTSMSEDYPVGQQNPKFGLSMQVSYVCEYDSDGEWIGGGLSSLGGDLIDVPSYS